MKRGIQAIIIAAAVSLLAFTAPAQDAPVRASDRTDYPHEGLADARLVNGPHYAAQPNELVGTEVNMRALLYKLDKLVG